jgi:hypothetical protein
MPLKMNQEAKQKKLWCTRGNGLCFEFGHEKAKRNGYIIDEGPG